MIFCWLVTGFLILKLSLKKAKIFGKGVVLSCVSRFQNVVLNLFCIRYDLAPSLSEIDLGSQPLPDSKTLELVWDT